MFNISNPIFIVLGIDGIAALIALAYMGYDIWNKLRPGYLRAYIREKGAMVRVYWVPIVVKEGKEIVTIDGQSYNVDPDCIERMTRWRMPSSWYIRNDPNPLNWDMLKLSNGPSATDLHDALESHVVRDALSAFKPHGLLTAETTTLLAIIIVVAGLGIGYYYLNQQFTKVFEMIGGMS